MMEGSDTTAVQFLAQGDSLFVDEDYTGAVDAYAAGLIVFRPADGLLLKLRTLSHRSAAFLQLRRFEEALNDAQEALNQVSSAASATTTAAAGSLEMRAGESEMLYKRAGMAATNLQRMEEAKQFFQQAYQLAKLNGRDTKSYDQYMIRPETTTASATNTTAQKVPTSKASSPQAPTTTPRIQQKAPTPTVTKQQPPTMPKYQYYQSDKVMTISILEPNMQPQNIDVDFRKKHLTVILRKRGISFTVIAGTLYSEIEVEKSKTVIKDEKVLIKLRKVDHFDWHELLSKKKEEEVEEKPDAKVQEEDNDNDNAVTRPTPYASHKDWDKIEKDLEVQEKQETGEGDEALNKLFKQIYAGADEDTRRAMIKSYQTSGGTVLSTNWDDVKAKDYEKERTAPKGMEWKTWEGDKLPMTDDDE